MKNRATDLVELANAASIAAPVAAFFRSRSRSRARGSSLRKRPRCEDVAFACSMAASVAYHSACACVAKDAPLSGWLMHADVASMHALAFCVGLAAVRKGGHWRKWQQRLWLAAALPSTVAAACASSSSPASVAARTLAIVVTMAPPMLRMRPRPARRALAWGSLGLACSALSSVRGLRLAHSVFHVLLAPVVSGAIACTSSRLDVRVHVRAATAV